NASLARLLSGDVDVAADSALQFQQSVLLRSCAAEGKGRILLSPTQVRQFNIQLRPDYVPPRAILDLRVRKAIMHPLDRHPNRDEQISTFPALRTTYATLLGDYAMNKFSSAEIATAEKAWRGSNRTGWSYPEFDRVYEEFSRALDRTERNRSMADMARLLNDQ